MIYANYFYGMHLIWWLIWGVMIFWIFATPYSIPGQRMPKDSPIDILKMRLASGEIKIDEYHAMKVVLEKDEKA